MNNHLLSLVIYVMIPPSYEYYTVYNVDITTGREVSTEDLLQKLGISADEYHRLAKEAVGSRFWRPWDRTDSCFQEPEFVSVFNEALEKTISQENIDQSQPYVDGNGDLCLAAKVYSFESIEYYWDKLNLYEYEFVSDYDIPVQLINVEINITQEEAYQIACDYWNSLAVFPMPSRDRS